MTLDDWQALDARIARMMGWIEWNDIPRADRDSILRRRGEDVPEILSKTSPEWRAFALETVRAFWWEHHDEHGWIHAYERRDWQPHKDVAQALAAKNRLVSQGWRFQLKTFPPTELSLAKSAAEFYTYGTPPYYSRADADAKAICLAIEEWMDTQKEKP